MSEKSIESRRAFFKKAGKMLGTAAVTAAVAVPFLTAAAKDAMANELEKEGPVTTCTSCTSWCGNSCGDCTGTCTGSSTGRWK